MLKISLISAMLIVFNLLNAQSYKNLNNVPDDVLSKEELATFKVLAKQRIDELQGYISRLASKTVPQDEKELILDQLDELFSKNALIEVSSRSKRNIKTYPYRAYFLHLASLPYISVEIKWYDLAYVSDFISDPDGDYKANATVFQKFKGTSNGGYVYEDFTKKQIELNLSADRASSEKRYVLYLGNVTVKETKANERL